MRIALIAFTSAGEKTCLLAANHLERAGHCCLSYTKKKPLSEESKRPGQEVLIPVTQGLLEWSGEAFEKEDALVFIGALGIAVRAIAPFLKGKTKDPAVVVVDELGKFSVSLLSGHIGGANDLASELALGLGAIPVITTATDINGRFSVDQWAREQGLAIESMEAAKSLSAALLEGKPIGFFCPFAFTGSLPSGLIFCGENDWEGREKDRDRNDQKTKERPKIGIAVSIKEEENPFEVTVRLIPRVLVLGIGCRKGKASEAITAAVQKALAQLGLSKQAVFQVASIDLKEEEPGLLEFCSGWSLPLAVYSADSLLSAKLPEEDSFTASSFVKSVTGVDNVCERAALLACGETGKLILKKQAGDGVTVAIALRELSLRFDSTQERNEIKWN